MTTTPDELIEREREFWEAAGDPEYYRRHFADDGHCVFGFGVLDKTATVASMTGAPEWQDVEMRDVHVVEIADGTAAVLYSAEARDAAGQPYNAIVSSVYVRRSDAWLLALHHQIPQVDARNR